MLIPAIDLQGGAVVQLVQGERLAIKDLDRVRLGETLRAIPQSAGHRSRRGHGRRRQPGSGAANRGALSCRVGGGVRTSARASEILAAGAQQIIAGSALFKDGRPDVEFAKRLARRRRRRAHHSRPSTAAGGQVVVHGWKTPLPLTAVEAVQALEPYCGEFLYTHVDTEGLMQGTNFDAILAVRRATTRRLTAAGGITTREEIDDLERAWRRRSCRHGALHRTDRRPPVSRQAAQMKS